MSDSMILTLKESSEWIECLAKLPPEQQDVYFTPDYHQLYEANGDGKATCFVFKREEHIAIYPFLINRINDFGYRLNNYYYDINSAYGYGGVATSCNSASFIREFYVAWNKWCGEHRIVSEFVRFHPIICNHQFSNSYYDINHDRETVYLDITQGIDQIWKNSYSSKCRNMIRKAQKQDYIVDTSIDNNNTNAFESVYYGTMDRLKADNYYLFSEEYFRLLFTNPKHTKIVTIKKDSITIASMLMLVYGIYAHYHLSGRNISSSDNSVNNYILDIAIKYAQGLGCKIMHFGGGRTREVDDSLLKFKKSFSSTHSSFFIGTKVHLPEVYNEIRSQWAVRNPSAAEKHSAKLQGYRIIN